MREKIKELNRFKKVILILLVVLTVAYTVAYAVAAGRTGLVYRDEILRPLADGSGWAGKVDGTEVMISFADDGMYYTVDGTTTGPYSLRKDKTALPEETLMGPMDGVEIRCGDRVLFRGGAHDFGSYVCWKAKMVKRTWVLSFKWKLKMKAFPAKTRSLPTRNSIVCSPIRSSDAKETGPAL